MGDKVVDASVCGGINLDECLELVFDGGRHDERG